MFRRSCFWSCAVPSFAGCYSSGCCWSWSPSLRLSSSGQEGRPASAGRFSSSVARAGAVCIWIWRLQYGQNMTAAALSVRPCLWSWFHAARAASGAGCKMIHAGRARAAAILSILASCAAPVDCLYNVWRVMFSRSARSANVRPRALQSILIFSFISMLANVAYLFDFCKMGGQRCQLSPGGPGWPGVAGPLILWPAVARARAAAGPGACLDLSGPGVRLSLRAWWPVLKKVAIFLLL